MIWKGWIIVSEYLEGWEQGYATGCSQGDSANRISAFGAIRRAAEVARQYDTRADIAFRELDEVRESECWSMSVAIRRAIRAAIGSDKL